jgi:hypothetical protein
MATISANGARQLTAQHRAAGSEYVSAPVFGRPPAAAQGQLDIVAAGSESALARCRPLFEVLGRQSFVVGAEPYQANIAKIARNFLLATVIESLGEAFALVRKSGLDPALFLDVLTRTSFSAPVYKNYGRMIVEQTFEPATFVLRLGLKDVELALEAGGDSQVPMPMAALIREQHLGALAADSEKRIGPRSRSTSRSALGFDCVCAAPSGPAHADDLERVSQCCRQRRAPTGERLRPILSRSRGLHATRASTTCRRRSSDRCKRLVADCLAIVTAGQSERGAQSARNQPARGHTAWPQLGDRHPASRGDPWPRGFSTGSPARGTTSTKAARLPIRIPAAR